MVTFHNILSRRPGYGISNFVVLVALAGIALAACKQRASDDQAAALASAREAQVRAEAELKAIKEAAALHAATPPPPPAPVPPVPTAARIEPKTTNPLPDPSRIKGDLVGRTFRGGMLTQYKFDSLSDILALKVLNRQVAGNVAEYSLDTTLRKDPASSKRCFAALRVTYRRSGEAEPWAFGDVVANTFTCE